MQEILAGEGFGNAVKELELHATIRWHNKRFQVWEIGENDLQKMISIPNEDWKSAWGWWRHAKGSNITDWPVHTFSVKGTILYGWYDPIRLEDYKDEECDFSEDFFEKEYASLTGYISGAIGASTETNLCAIAVDLAKLNGLTLAQLFAKYQ